MAAHESPPRSASSPTNPGSSYSRTALFRRAVPHRRCGRAGGESIDLATGWTVTFTPAAATFNGPTDAPRAAAQVAPAAAPLDRLRSWTEDEATLLLRHGGLRDSCHAAGPVPAVPPARDAAVRRRDAGQPAHDGHHDAFRHGGAGAAACVDRSRCAKWRSSTSTASARARVGAAVCHRCHRVPDARRKPSPRGRRQHHDQLHGGRPLPSYRLLNLRYGERFTPQDMKDLQPLPSGILGPVRWSRTW